MGLWQPMQLKFVRFGSLRAAAAPAMSSVRRVVTLKRITLAILVVSGVLLFAVFALWLLPAWLTQHPHLNDPAERQKAASDARTGVVAFIAVLGGLGGLYYTSKTFRASREAQDSASKTASEAAQLSQETFSLSERGQITDRYSKAVEQLGDDSHDVCIGGIYALGQIMLDTRDMHDTRGAYEPAIVEVLSAFIRRNAQRKDDLKVPWSKDEAERDEDKPSFRIQAALNVLVKSRPNATPPDLRDCDLRGARLRDAQLPGAIFRRSYLHKAKLDRANLMGASLVEADLTEANLTGTLFSHADMEQTRLTARAVTPERLKNARNANRIECVALQKEADPQATADQTPD